MRAQPAGPPAAEVLLLTSFEPFGGDVHNPSQALVQTLDGAVIGGLRVGGVVLPCAFGAAPAVLQAALARWQPRLVLALGQAGGRTELSLERVAINLVDARIADNTGQQPIDVPVVEGGPAAYFSTLPIKPMVQALRAAGLPAGVSHTAGTFVCNQVFYVLQHLLAGAVPAGFMHVPFLPEQAALRAGATAPGSALPASLAFDDMLRGLRVALGAALSGLAVAGPGALGAPQPPSSEGQLD